MPHLRSVGRALKRALKAVLKLFARLIWLGAFALLIILPVPVVVLFPKLSKTGRKNDPAEVLRKK